MEKSWIIFVRLRPKTYSYLIETVVKIKKQKEKKAVSWKENLNLNIVKTA